MSSVTISIATMPPRVNIEPSSLGIPVVVGKRVDLFALWRCLAHYIC